MKFSIYIVTLFFTINLFSQTEIVPTYFTLLKSEHPNIHLIVNEYNNFHEHNEWTKNEYTRAYKEFLRAYSFDSFDANGNPILPSLKEEVEYSAKDTRAGSEGDWIPLKVKIDRTNCYATGQNGVVRSLAATADIVFAGGLSRGLWKSEDKGVNWSDDLLKDYPRISSVNKIVISPSNPDYIYIATNAGIFKSDDEGETISSTTLDYRYSFPNTDFGGDDYRSEYMFVDVSNSNPNRIVASDISPSDLITHIKVSNDGGITWITDVNFGYKNFPIDIKFHPTNDNIIYTLIFEDHQIKFYRSTDGGATFTNITDGYANYENVSHYEIKGRIALTPAQPDLVMFYLNVNSAGTGFYKSINAGISFEKTCCGDPTDFVNNASASQDFYGETMSGVQIRWATTMVISADNPNHIIAATNNQPRHSLDQGENWYWTSEMVPYASLPYMMQNNDGSCTTYIHGDIQDMAMVGDEIWVANDGGIAYSDDGGVTYHERADGLPITMALGFDMVPGKKNVIVAAMDHNGVIVYDQEQYGDYWKPMGGGDASGASVNPVDDQWLYAIPSGSNIIKRPLVGADHGHPSYVGTGGVNFGSGYVSRFNNMEYHPNFYYTLFAIDYASNTLKKSEDNGLSWEVLKSLESGDGWSFAQVKISKSNPDVLYLFDVGNATNNAFKSTDGGENWNSILPDDLSSGDRIKAIEIDSENSDIVWLVVNNYWYSNTIYKTVDGGENWIDYSEGMGDYNITSIVHQKGTDQGVYIGTRLGTYYRDDSMEEWIDFGTGLPGLNIDFIKINYALGVVRASTRFGIFEHELHAIASPKAEIYSDKNSIYCRDSISFSAATSALFDAETSSYEWYFENGTPETSTQENVIVRYSIGGSHDVRLIVHQDAESDTLLFENYITVIASEDSPCDGFSGNSSNSVIPHVNVYPNPSTGLFYVEGVQDETQIVVYDVLLNKIKTQYIEDNTIIDLSNYANGVYFVFFKRNNQEIEVKKIYKE